MDGLATRRPQRPSRRAGGRTGVEVQASTPARRPRPDPRSIRHQTSSRPSALSREKRPARLAPLAAMHRLLVALLVVLLAAARPAAAASVAFQNCLPDDYRDNKDPVLLQWVPLHVDASFRAAGRERNGSRTLVVTLYGNVTGSRSSAPLPAWDSPLWADSNQTDGKILQEPDPTSASPKLTTLHSKIDVLTYEPWNSDADFCADALINASCPLGPVFNTTPVADDALPAVSLAHTFDSSYAFASFSATFLVFYGDDASTTIGCVSATVTPGLGSLAWVVRYLPLLVLLAVGFATLFAGIYSPWGTTDVFHWSSNYGRDPDLLRLVTPGFGDCLQYLQFVVLTGGLTLSYPGFYQPVVSQAAWSTLLFNHSFVHHHHDGGGNGNATTAALALASPGTVVDGIYATRSGDYGLQSLAQLVGLAHVDDVWPGMMVWLLVIIAAALVLFQLAFGLQWVYRVVRRIPEEDLRSKNGPFSVGTVVRVVFNFFLLPLVALSTFQFVVAPRSPNYSVALAAVTLVAILGFAAWLLHLITSTKPRAVLFDDLPTLLLYGPLYNTYSDEAAPYALSPFALTLVRGIAIGAVQPVGIVQIVLLAICEVVQILTLQAILPFPRQSSMNAYHTLFAAMRFVTIMLMIAFIPTLGVPEGTKGWIGYVILVIHAGILVLGFFLNAIQTVLEVSARLAGAGGDDVTGQTRGGLSKIFGMRQLARRMPRRVAGATSRQSQVSSAAMLDAEDASKAGFVMPGGRLRSESAGSIGVLMTGKPGQRSSSALDNLSVDTGAMAATPGAGGRHLESGHGSYTPTTAGEMSSYSFLPSPTVATAGGAGGPLFAAVGAGGVVGAMTPLEAADPYYRPPRRTRRPTINQDNAPSPAERTRGSWASGDWGAQQTTTSPISPCAGSSGAAAPASAAPAAAAAAAAVAAAAAAAAAGATGANTPGDPADFDGQLSGGATPAPYAPSAINPSPRTDYSTREVDFYYGVRGQRLNSDAPSRKLGTGPADPTGPMASATGWLRTILGGKSKEKGKGFEVVRSSRMPPAMLARGGVDFEDEGPPPGIPVAMDVIRNGPIEPEDEEEDAAAKRKRRNRLSRDRPAGETNQASGAADLLDAEGNPRDEGEASEGAVAGEGGVSGVGVEAGDASEAGENVGTSAASSPRLRVSDVPPLLPSIDAGESIHLPSRVPSRVPSRAPSGAPSRTQSKASRYAAGGGNNGEGGPMLTIPGVPLLSSVPSVARRVSRTGGAGTASSPSTGSELARLPFERRSSSIHGRLSEGSSSNAVATDELAPTGGAGGAGGSSDRSTSGAPSVHEERPTSIGYVQQGSISRIDPEQHPALAGSSAEIVDDR